LLHRVFAAMPILPTDASEDVEGADGGHWQQAWTRPLFDINVTIDPYYHCLQTISHYAYCCPFVKSLCNMSPFPDFQCLRHEYIWPYEHCTVQNKKIVIHKDSLFTKSELGYSMKMLVGLYPTWNATPETN
jgi:hypothetical protein